MKFLFSKVKLPSLVNSLLAVASAILLTLAFPNFDLWFLAWFALVPLFFAIEREKESIVKSSILGWIFGTLFFAGSCWWLTFAFTHYGGIPTSLAYVLLLVICSIMGLFFAVFGAAFSIVLRRFGTYGILSAPFLWTAMEFLRANTADTSWNAIGYSQAFALSNSTIEAITVGGIYLAGFNILVWNTMIFFLILFFDRKNLSFKHRKRNLFLKEGTVFYSLFAYLLPFAAIIVLLVNLKSSRLYQRRELWRKIRIILLAPFLSSLALVAFVFFLSSNNKQYDNGFNRNNKTAFVTIVQANVPMSGLNEDKWLKLRQRHAELAETAFDANISKLIDKETAIYSTPEKLEKDKIFYNEFYKERFQETPKLVIFPESPMNFTYGEDAEFRTFIGDFARKHNASVLFNSAEPNPSGDNYFNSAIMVNPQGAKIGQYDKIHLVPFGEFAPVPSPIKPLIPTLVGSFQTGENYRLFPVGDAQAGIMICYESHFPSLSREFVKRGADVLIEMTNDGYLGNTAVLRQHLAGAIFRAVETNRPVLRATNVGVTAYINERGEVSDAADVYTEATRVWTVSKSDGGQTFYVRYGDWFAWLCSIVSIGLLIFSFWKKRSLTEDLHR